MINYLSGMQIYVCDTKFLVKKYLMNAYKVHGFNSLQSYSYAITTICDNA